MYKIYIISDSSGETAESLVKAAASQFSEEYDIIMHSHVRDEMEVEMIFNDLINTKSLVFYTIVSNELLSQIKKLAEKHNVKAVDLLTPSITAIKDYLGVEPISEPGRNRVLDEDYFKRIAAVEFAVKYDDGKDPRSILKSDIVLLGVSRTSKTPLSMYLANKNYKVSNIPLVPEAPLPKELKQIDRKKIIGLTTTPEKLNEIRTERLKALGLKDNSSYADLNRILDELEYADKIMKEYGCAVINVANKAIEETAGIIIEIIGNN